MTLKSAAKGRAGIVGSIFPQIFGLLLLSLLVVKESAAVSTDAAMILRMDGDVTYKADIHELDSFSARAFMKLKEGDRLMLGQDAEVQLVFFSGGRRETWKGPVSLRIDKLQGIPAGESDAGKTPKVSELLPQVTEEMKRVTTLVDAAHIQRTGAYRMRSISREEKKKEEKKRPVLKSDPLDDEEKRKIEVGQQIYQILLWQTDPEDITPELYLFGLMSSYRQYEQMYELIRRMREKQPDNKGIDSLESWFREREEKER